MIEIRMPKLSEQMTEGKLLLWSVAVGDYVKAGDQIGEIEADKANMEIESPVDGTVYSLHGQPGQTIAVDTVLVELNEELAPRASADDIDSSVMGPEQVSDEPDSLDSPLAKRLKKFAEGQ